MSSTSNGMSSLLWFDVERRYKTIRQSLRHWQQQLWFDVERRYKTIIESTDNNRLLLWFDVERRYKTIWTEAELIQISCGLM